MEVRDLQINWIRPNCRLVYDEEVILRLADNVKSLGQQKPIVVEWVGCCFHIIEGEEYWRACKKMARIQLRH